MVIKMKKSSMADVARLAGVSIATVSHVISGKRYVSDEMTQRVKKAIEELAYTPNLAARNLKTGKSNAILFIVPNIGNSFFSTAVEELETYFSEVGYRLLITSTKEDVTREAEQLHEINSSMVDGVILASAAESYDQLMQYLPHKLPIVLFDRSFDAINLSSVVCNSAPQLSEAVTALYKKGHRRIGFIVSRRRISSTQERLGAYLHVMEQFGISDINTFIKESEDDYAKVEIGCAQLLQEGTTAIIASDGAISFYTRHACIQMGKILGKNIEIVGYVDAPNTDLMIDYFATIKLPIREAAHKAGEEIISCVQNPNIIHKIELSATLIFRQS